MKICLLFIFLLTLTSPAIAYDWNNVWLNKNQQGLLLLKKNQPEKAAQYFQDPYWQGIAAYRANDYQNAAALFSEIHTSDGLYNFGNALAKQGLYQDAIDAYDAALKQNPNHQDAQYNREVVRKLLTAQEQQQQQPPTSPPQQNQPPPESPEEKPKETPPPPPKQAPQKNEEQQADEQRLRQIPDDPGGLLRRKFLREHQRMQGR